MNLPSASVFDAIRCANLHAARLFVSNRALAREYCSVAVRCYDDLLGRGLRKKNPVQFMYRKGWARPVSGDRVELPMSIQTGGGTRLEELVILAMVTRALQPAKVFEIGTFRGQTTSVLRLNAPPSASVVTLDLPPDALPAVVAAGGIDTDIRLIQQREVGSLLRELRIDSECQQILCDSLAFDPAPHRGTVELGFIDGSHSRRHVENDTRKMAVMMAPRGLIFWHDYGGKGRFRELTNYLNALNKTIALYRVPRTTLAWTTAEELRKVA